MAFFKKPQYSTVTVPVRTKDIPENLFTKCPVSGEIIFNRELEKNLMVVPGSGYHFPLNSKKRIESLLDEGSFDEHDAELRTIDVLNFKGLSSYKEKLEAEQKKTEMPDALLSGIGVMSKIEVSIAVSDFRFIAGSMGNVVGEKITRAIERAVNRKIPLIIVSGSGGGARMQEGVYSLMQMAKTSAALSRLHEIGIPYISILTNPTLGGASASFATLGDVILAEPGALIGFSGPRVIKETIQAELPEGFQTSEFLLERGLIDQIVPRMVLRERVITLLNVLYRGRCPSSIRKKL